MATMSPTRPLSCNPIFSSFQTNITFTETWNDTLCSCHETDWHGVWTRRRKRIANLHWAVSTYFLLPRLGLRFRWKQKQDSRLDSGTAGCWVVCWVCITPQQSASREDNMTKPCQFWELTHLTIGDQKKSTRY
jgi:hypothetical protein